MSDLMRRREMMIEESWLPEGCVELEYLESTYTQWIDTGYTSIDNEIVVNCVAQAKSESCESLFGSRTGVGINDIRMLHSSFSMLIVGVGMSTLSLGTTLEKVKYTVLGVGEFKKDDVRVDYIKNATFSSKISMHLFSFNNNGTIISHGAWKMYSFNISGSGGEMNLLPILDSTGRPCMYDTIGKQYYYNQGTGEFLYKIKE